MDLKNKNTYYLGNENLPTKNTQIECTAEEFKHYTKEIEKCKKDLLYFAENYFYIINPDEGKIKIPLHKYQKRFLRKIRDNRFIIFNTSRQVGKALCLDTPILTPTGWTTQGKLKIGDRVYDENGKICNVTYVHPIENDRKCYKIIFDNGEEIISSAEHEWFTQTKQERLNNVNGSIKTTQEIYETLKSDGLNHRIKKSCKIEHINHQQLQINLEYYCIGDEKLDYIYIRKIIPIESVPVRCITVDSPSHLYLAGKQLIPTHNSTILTIYALWYAINNPDKFILLLANKEDTAIEIFARIKEAYIQLPNWLKPGVEKWDQTKVILTNGSKISVSTTTESAARGYTINVLLLDEFAFVDQHKAEEFFKSVYPTVSASKTSKIIITSTPNGDDNIFYRLFTGAVAGDNGWVYDTVIWSDVPGRDEKWKERTLKSMGSAEAFAQEFEATFISSKSNFINEEIIQQLKTNINPPLYIYEEGCYKIWQEPKEDRIYVAGVDVSEGVNKDSSVINIMDITNLQDIVQVATYVNNNIQPYDFTTKTYEILQQWGCPLAAIERNNQGGGVIDGLINRFGYENIISYGASLVNRKNVQQGIVSHTNVRSKAVSNMRYLLTDAQVVTINDDTLIEEFRNFVRNPNGTWAARKGSKYNDDRVLSLTWALFVIHNDLITDYFEIKNRDKHGIACRIEKQKGINYFIKPENNIFENSQYHEDCFFTNNNIGESTDIDWNWLSTY